MGFHSVSVEIAGSDDELRSLGRWLRDEDDLRGRVMLIERPISPEAMGGLLDFVEVAVTSSTVATLVRCLFGWLKHRRTVERVTVKVGSDLECSFGSADDATKVLSELRDLFGRDFDGGDDAIGNQTSSGHD